jgi:hypothetical protein
MAEIEDEDGYLAGRKSNKLALMELRLTCVGPSRVNRPLQSPSGRR